MEDRLEVELLLGLPVPKEGCPDFTTCQQRAGAVPGLVEPVSNVDKDPWEWAP